MEKLIGFNALLDFIYQYQIYISSINIGYANWLIIIEKMILEITGTTPKPIPKRAGWKQMFRQDLYKRNK